MADLKKIKKEIRTSTDYSTSKKEIKLAAEAVAGEL